MKQLALTLLLLIACCATALAQTSNYLSAEYVGNSTVQSNITILFALLLCYIPALINYDK